MTIGGISTQFASDCVDDELMPVGDEYHVVYYL